MCSTKLNFAACKASYASCPNTWSYRKERAGWWMISPRNKRQPKETQMKSNDQASMTKPIAWESKDWCFSRFHYEFITNPNRSHLLSQKPFSSNLRFFFFFFFYLQWYCRGFSRDLTQLLPYTPHKHLILVKWSLR